MRASASRRRSASAAIFCIYKCCTCCSFSWRCRSRSSCCACRLKKSLTFNHHMVGNVDIRVSGCSPFSHLLRSEVFILLRERSSLLHYLAQASLLFFHFLHVCFLALVGVLLAGVQLAQAILPLSLGSYLLVFKRIEVSKGQQSLIAT